MPIRRRLRAAALALSLPAAVGAAEPVFDLHVHLWKGAESVAAYDRQLRDAGLEVARIGALPGGDRLVQAGQLQRMRETNDALHALARTDPRLMPIGTVHPYDGAAALAELERIAAIGFRAVKLHPHTQRFDPGDARVLDVARRAGELGLVVLLDNANVVAGDTQSLFNLALRAPKTHFVFNHLGGLDFRAWNILPLARTAEGLVADNIHFDLSATVVLVADSPLEEEFVWTVRNVGVEHVLLGSDFPQLDLPRTLDALQRLPLTDAEKRRIRWDNAQRLFGATPAARPGAPAETRAPTAPR